METIFACYSRWNLFLKESYIKYEDLTCRKMLVWNIHTSAQIVLGLLWAKKASEHFISGKDQMCYNNNILTFCSWSWLIYKSKVNHGNLNQFQEWMKINQLPWPFVGLLLCNRNHRLLSYRQQQQKHCFSAPKGLVMSSSLPFLDIHDTNICKGDGLSSLLLSSTLDKEQEVE